MSSLIFNNALDNLARGTIDFDTDTFKAMLVTSGYAENKDTHEFRSDVTNEVTGTGYTAGGATVTVTVTLDTVNDRIDISLGSLSLPTSTITARKAVYYDLWHASGGNGFHDLRKIDGKDDGRFYRQLGMG